MVESFQAGLAIFEQIRVALPDKSIHGLCFTICHDDEFVEHNLDLELGRIVEPNTPWMCLHAVRTLAAIAATALIFIVCLSKSLSK